MKKEVERKIIKNFVVIKYDDGSIRKIEIPKADLKIRADADSIKKSGHIFK